MIKENVQRILKELPEGVELVAAAKTRSPKEILEAIEGGIKIIGENYLQETLTVFEGVARLVSRRASSAIPDKIGGVKWHFIGHLQKNKVKKAVEIFDMIETVDSLEIAEELDKRCNQIGKVMPILIEINSGREKQKFGVSPEMAENLIKDISSFKNIKVMGLMTMGPRFGNPEDSRPYFIETRKIFERIKSLNCATHSLHFFREQSGESKPTFDALPTLPNVEMKYLSMGMTNSYKIAISEGANMVRLGTKIFGERKYLQKLTKQV